MSTKKFIGFVCLASLLLSCNRDEGIGEYQPPTTEKSSVNILISIAPETRISTGTELRPMSAQADDEIKAMIRNEYKALFLKEIENKWYVDTLVTARFDNSEAKLLEVRENKTMGGLSIELRPGHYRALFVLNPEYVSWNPRIVPGLLVQDTINPLDSIPYAFTYKRQTDPGFIENYKERMLMNEIFTGITEFTVNKTDNLHTSVTYPSTTVEVTRKVTRYRLLLKNYPEGAPVNAGIGSTVYLVITAEGDAKFCDGINCWGEAHYNPITPTHKINVRFTIGEGWSTDSVGNQYLMCRPGAHNYSPYLFADEKADVPYRVSALKILGASGGFTYELPSPVTEQILKCNSIAGIVVQPTLQIEPDGSQRKVTLRYLENEDPARLFGPFYEWNHIVNPPL